MRNKKNGQHQPQTCRDTYASWIFPGMTCNGMKLIRGKSIKEQGRERERERKCRRKGGKEVDLRVFQSLLAGIFKQRAILLQFLSRNQKQHYIFFSYFSSVRYYIYHTAQYTMQLINHVVYYKTCHLHYQKCLESSSPTFWDISEKKRNSVNKC